MTRQFGNHKKNVDANAGKRKGNARQVAVGALLGLLEEGKSFDAVLENSAAFLALELRDQGFVKMLLRATLKHLRGIDALIDAHVEKPLKNKYAHTQAVLRLAVAQLLVLKTPAHAAIDTAVELVRADKRNVHFAGLANAVLRKIASETLPDVATHFWPAWLEEKLRASYGKERSEGLARSYTEPAAVDLWVKENVDGWAQTLTAKKIFANALRLGDVEQLTELPGYKLGAWWVQDVAATLPVQLLGEVKGKRALDVCAAPGGKTMQLAHAGANVTAIDISESRLKRLKENLARTKLSANVVAADALQWKSEEKFDCVLIDAPCSAIGTARRNPDVLWLRKPEELQKLVSLQGQFLDKLESWLTPGGSAVYAVCSLLLEEGEQQIAAFLTKNKAFSLHNAALDAAATQWGMLRTPHGIATISVADSPLACDGFFMTKLMYRHD